MPSPSRSPRFLLSGARGVAIVEFALVVPVLTTILIGTFWLGRAVSVHQALERAAREGARVGITPACALCGSSTATDASIDVAVNGALAAASLDTSNPGLEIVIARNQRLDSNDPANYQSSGVQVTVSYPVQLNIPFTSQRATTISLTSSVSMRQEF
ncbi:MAG TPA: TadE/TadG family type IV pilus assembly protein [Verrucomicrobiae bacterium]|jgi:Flp pilus assembly protein TadG|nr:TadE/TadG family type IV pilus assembly protein [Verrucomicrobiae bacterium]